MRIFVTGGTGFIGSFVLDLLAAQGHQVLALVGVNRPAPTHHLSSVKMIRGDFGDLHSFKHEIQHFNPETTIHLAWQGIPDFSPAMCQVNLKQSIALTDFLINETQCRKIVFAGSCFEYGPAQGPCSEELATAPISIFTWAKLSLYQYASLVCKEKGVSCLWMRIFYVYGPGQRKKSLIPTLIDSFVQGAVPGIQNPFNANDFVYVADVAEGFCRAAVTAVPSGIYNLGSGRSASVMDVCEIAEQEIRKSTSFSQKLKEGSTAKQTTNFWADTQKTKTAFGWTPVTSLKEGISQTIAALERA